MAPSARAVRTLEGPSDRCDTRHLCVWPHDLTRHRSIWMPGVGKLWPKV